MSKESNIQNLTEEILNVTSKIQEKFPELYKLLHETPLFISYEYKGIRDIDLEQYLESLKIQFRTFEKVGMM